MKRLFLSTRKAQTTLLESPQTPHPVEVDDAYSQAGFPALPPSSEDEAAPHGRLQVHRNFRSRFLPDKRNLIVYLPPSYATEPERRFPVLYLQDGQNLFDGRTSFIPGRTWQVRETADAAIEAGEVEPLIIVGIYNTAARLAEYTPTRHWKMGGGEAPAYGRLIVEELMPFIQKRYRARSEREHTGVGGSSLGGLVSLYLGLEYPGVFGHLAIHSPSVWWNNRSILGLLRNTSGVVSAGHRARMWLDTGDAEGPRTLEDANRLYRQLVKQGWRPEVDLHYEICPGGTHSEDAWATRVGPMLRFLFPAQP